jgi:hypothetical protein
MVFAGAALSLGATACGRKSKPPAQASDPPNDPYYQNHPCTPPDEERARDLEKQQEAAKTEAEKARLQQDIDEARMGVCAPYGAPPRRRRVV